MKVTKRSMMMSTLTVAIYKNTTIITSSSHDIKDSFTFCIWPASSLVGDNTNACVSLTCVSRPCRMDIENVAVFPVPD